MKNKLRLFEAFRLLLSVFLALALVAVIIFFVSDEPLVALSALITGPIREFSRLGNVIEMAIPLSFTGLAVCVMFKANQFNMVTEGAFYIAAVVAAYVAIFFPLPPVILPLVAIVCGMLAGGLLGSVPAILKIKTNSSVIVVSLMLNYVVALLGRFLISNVMRDPSSGSGSSYAFQKIAKLPVLIPGTRIHFGFILMILATVFVFTMVYRSKLGYGIRMTGLNGKFSQYAGIPVNRTILLSQIIGGGIAGIGGSVEMLGMYSRFSWVGTPGYGWDAIIISILAKENPAFIPFSAFFLAYIRIGADIMAMTSDVPSEIVAIVQGVIILLLAAKQFLSKWRNKILIENTLQRKKTLGGES